MENKFPNNRDIDKLNKEISDIERAVEKEDKFFERKIDSIESHLEKEIKHEDIKVAHIEKKVKEIEKDIVDLNKATKALFKAFDGVHTSLLKKYHWYYNWHTKKTSTPLHYIALAAATAFIIYIFGFQLGFFGGHREPTYADTGINKMMNYQGKLTDASNIPVPDGSYNMKISIYSASSGGTPIWTWKGLTSLPEAVSVTVTNSLFSVMLGDTVTWPGTNALNLDFNSDTYYLGITVGTDAEMSPRKRIGAAGYAYNADTVDGKHETDFALLAGRSGGQALDGGTDANDDLTLQGTSNSTRTTSYVLLQPNGGNVGIGTTSVDEKFQVEDSSTNSSPAIKLENDAKAWRLLIDGADSDKLKLQETTDSNANVFTVDPGTQSVTFFANLNANSGIDISGAALTIDNQAITQTTGGQVTFAGNVDANAGLDVTGNITLIQGGSRSISVTQNASGAGDNLTISAGAAFASSNTNGGNLVLNAGAKDGSGTAGVIQIGGSNTSAVTITPVATFEAFPVTPSSAPTTDYQVANKKYVDDSVVDPAGSNMEIQYNNNGVFGGASQVLYDDVNNYLGIGTFPESYDTYTKLMMHMEGNGQLFDDSALNHTVTPAGDITQTDTQYKFGAKSALLDGTGDYLQVPYDSDFNFSSGLWTIDTWMRPSSLAKKTLFGSYTYNSSFNLVFNSSTSIRYNYANFDSGYVTFSCPEINLDAWHHVALVANGTTIELYVDGQSCGSTTHYPINTNNPLDIGTIYGKEGPDYYSNPFQGYIDEFRISKGIARWTSNFTPPTAAYEADTTDIDEQLQVSNLTANSTPAIKVNNDATGWRLIVDGADSDKLKLQETTDSNANVFTVDPGTQSVTFFANLNANSGIDISGAALTIDNQAITQTTGGQVTFAGNVDANSGVDVTGALTVTTNATIPTLYGSSTDNGDITINGTSSATKTTSYVLLQPSGGNVGIGTTDPQTKLQVQASGESWVWGGITVSPVASSSSYWNILGGNGGNGLLLGSGASGEDNPLSELQLGVDSTINFLNGSGAVAPTSAMYINSSQNVGIGTTSIDERLHIEDSSSNSSPAIKLENDAKAWRIQIDGADNDTLKLQETTDGNANVFIVSPGTQIVTFSQFPITPSAAPTTDYQVANKKYVDDSVVDPAGTNMQMQYNNSGAFGGASQVLYDNVNSRLGIGTFAETYDSYTKLMLHAEGDGQSFIDSSNNATVTAHGNTTQSTAQYKFGSKSVYFDGNGDYLTTSVDNGLGNGDYTVDFWTRINSLPSSGQIYYLFAHRTSSPYVVISVDSDGKVTYWNNTYAFTTSNAVTAGSWYHIALARYSGAVSLYINGILGGTIVDDTNQTNTTFGIGLEENGGSDSAPYLGYIDELRISKGVARWTSNFTPPTSAYEPTSVAIDEQLQVSNISANSTPAIKVNNDATGWRLIVDGADSDKLKLQETTDSNANVFTVDPGTQSVTFYANLNANSGIDISGAALTIDNQAITQTTGGQVTFAGNVDANAGLDVTGNITLIQGGSRSISVTQNASGAGDNLTISAGAAFASSNTNGGNLILNAGAKDGSGTAGVIQIGGSNTSGVTITPVATFESFPVTPSSDPTTDYQVANKQYVDNHITSPAGSDMELQYNNNGTMDGASQLLYDDINDYLGIGSFPETYDTYTKLMLHMEGDGQSFVDSALGKTITAVDGATQTTAAYKFGAKSAYLDGSGDKLTIPYDSDFELRSSLWTVDGWFYPQSVGNKALFGTWNYYTESQPNGSFGIAIVDSTTIKIFHADFNDPIVVTVPEITLNSWHHIALEHSATNILFFLDGSLLYNSAGTFCNPANTLAIGRIQDKEDYGYFQGYVDEFRWSEGITRWTASFTPPTQAYEPDSIQIDEQLQVSNLAVNSTPAIKINNDVTGWRLVADGSDSDKLKLQQSFDTNGDEYDDTYTNVFSVDPSTNSVTFYANLNANSGIDITGAALTIDNQAITQTTGGQVTFAGNVDANAGLDVTGNITLIQGGSRSISVTQNASGAGDNLTISAGAAFASSNTNGGNLILNAGAEDGSGTAGVIQIGGSNTSEVTITPVATFEAFPVTPSSAPTTDYQVANKKYVDDSVVDPAGSNMEMQYNNNGSFGGATQVLYDDINSRLGIGSFLETYDSYTKLMLHMEGDGNSFVDSALNKTVTAHGDITQTATQYKFGAKSAIFDGTADYLTLADSDDWDTETTFTIDFWCRFNAINSTIFVANTDDAASVPGFQIAYQDDIHTIFYNVASGGSGWDRAHVSGSWSPNINTWYHVAVVANAGSVNIYIDGNSVGNGTTLSSSSSSSLNIGIDPGIIKNINGYIDEFRISKGIARWTSDFTPPTQAYEPTSIAINEQLQVSNVATDSTPAIKVNNDTTGWRFLVDGSDSDKLKLQETTDSNANIFTVTSGTQDVLFGGKVTTATLYGSSADNGDINIEGTSSATKTTSYVNLQPNGGYIGIGTTSPRAILDVVSATDHVDMILDSGSGKQAAIHFFENGVSSWKMGAVGDDNDRFAIKYNETAEVFTILTGGNVGIGTASPNELLTVASDLGTGYQRVATFLDTNSGAIDPHIMVGNGTDANKGMALGWDSTNNVAWIAVSGDGAGDGFTQKRGGTVGIGTATPGTGDASVFQTVLEVHKSTANSDPAIVLSNDAQTWGILTVGSRNDNFEIVDSTAAGDPTRLTIDTNGKVGIGTAAPSWLLHVKGTTAANSGIVELENTYTDGEAGIIFKNDAHQWNSYVNSSDKYVIRDDTQSNDAITLTPATDYVGINYASPDCELWVKDGPDALGNADIVISSDTGAASAMHWLNNTTGKWTMKSDGADSDKFTFEIDSGSDIFSVVNATQILTFAQFPITPSSAPTTDYQVANKKYVDDAGTTYALLAGRSGGQSLNGGTNANDDLTLQGTSNSTRTTSYVNIQPNGGNVGVGTTTPGQEMTIQRLATTEKESLLSVDQMALSELQGGAYFGNVGITENQWEVSNIGTTWTAKGLAKNWWSVAMNSDGKYQSATVGTNSDTIYISSDFGATWTSKDSTRDWKDIAMSSDGKIQTAVVQNGNIYVSTDYGNTWTAKDSSRYWWSVYMSSDGKYQSAVVYGGEIYVSTDFGNTWAAKDSSRSWYGIAMSSDGKIQTAVDNSGYIYVSTDYGNTWSAKDSSRTWYDVAMSSDGKIQTATSQGQIYVSTDYGNTWAAKDSSRSWRGVAMSANGQIQTAVVNGGGYIYVSTDYGNTWAAKGSSLSWYGVAMNSDGKIQIALAMGIDMYISYASSYTTGSVGIGVSNPTEKLTIADSVANSTPAVKIENDTKAWRFIIDGADSDIFKLQETTDSNTNVFSVTPDTQAVYFTGKVGVGAAAPTNGGLLVSAGVTIGTDSTDNLIDDASNGAGSATLYIGNKTIDTSVPSDRSIKTNIVPTSIGLDELLNMEVVDFNFTAQFTNDTQTLHHGMIAQDVAKIYPYAVSMRSDGLMMIDYDNLMPLVIKSIQEQEKEIKSLSALNGDLQGNVYKDITTNQIVIEKDAKFKGDVEVVGSVSIAKDLKVEGQTTFGKDSVGQAKILTGAKRVKVTFEKEYQYQPIVTVTPTGIFDIKYAVENTTTKGFEIVIEPDQIKDVIFNWHAFGVDEGKIFVSDGTTQDIQIITSLLPPIPIP